MIIKFIRMLIRLKTMIITNIVRIKKNKEKTERRVK